MMGCTPCGSWSRPQAPLLQMASRGRPYVLKHDAEPPREVATVAGRLQAALRGVSSDAMQTLVAEILAVWQRAERLADSLPDGSPQQIGARLASERLRDLYHELTSTGAATPTTDADARSLLAE